jgi:hypothetical protein
MVSCHPNRAKDLENPTQLCRELALNFKIDHVHMEIVIGLAVRPQPKLRASSKTESLPVFIDHTPI